MIESVQDEGTFNYRLPLESGFRDCIADAMKDDGWLVSTEVRGEFGVADIVAIKDGQGMIIEAKLNADNNSMAHALGQLLFYKHPNPLGVLYPESDHWPSYWKLLVATPHRIPLKILKIFKDNGIYEFSSEFCKHYVWAMRSFVPLEKWMRLTMGLREGSFYFRKALDEVRQIDLTDAERHSVNEGLDELRGLTAQALTALEKVTYVEH